MIRRLQSGETSPYEITCLFNRRQRTPQSASWFDGELRLSDDGLSPLPTGENQVFHRGDGTIPGLSATPIEWSQSANAIALDEKHVAMPSARTLTDLLQNLASPLDTRAYMSSGPSDGSLGLSVPPLAMAGEAFEIEVDAVRAARLTVTVATVQAPSAPVLQELSTVKEGASARLELIVKMPGTYQVTARSADPLRPAISDWVVVIGRP